MAERTWLITGATRGLGLAIAREIRARGDYLVAGARNPDHLPADVAEYATPVGLDVTDTHEVSAAVALAENRYGRIDVVVNCAGRGLLGAVEETAADDVQAIFDVNVFGVLNVTRAVLPAMRRRRAGTVVNIGSTAGFVGAAGWGVYGATKFALEGLSESLRAEIIDFGIRVLLVEPAMLATDFRTGDSLMRPSSRIEHYAPLLDRIEHRMASVNPEFVGDSARAAAAIVEAVTSGASAHRLFLATSRPSAVDDKWSALLRELDEWQDVSAVAAHPES